MKRGKKEEECTERQNREYWKSRVKLIAADWINKEVRQLNKEVINSEEFTGI